MRRIRVGREFPLDEAIRRGRMEDVLSWVQSEAGLSGRIELSSEECEKWPSDMGFVSAFEYALLRKRWPIAIALMHAPDDYLEKRDAPEVERRAMAMLDLLIALDNHRPSQPLASRQRAQILQSWDLFDLNLQRHEGPDGENAQSMFRIKSVLCQPGWLGLVPHMIKQGINPNLHAVTSEGRVSTLLRSCATRGFKSDIQALLGAGADPLFKIHEGSLAAHAAADLAYFQPGSEPGESSRVPCIDEVVARKQCFELLNAIPGVAGTKNFQGKTPEKLWQEGIAWFAAQDLPKDPMAALAYEARKITLITPAATAPARPGPRM